MVLMRWCSVPRFVYCVLGIVDCGLWIVMGNLYAYQLLPTSFNNLEEGMMML